MLPTASAVALAAENSENALPRSASRLRRDSSTRSGVAIEATAGARQHAGQR